MVLEESVVEFDLVEEIDELGKSEYVVFGDVGEVLGCKEEEIGVLQVNWKTELSWSILKSGRGSELPLRTALMACSRGYP